MLRNAHRFEAVVKTICTTNPGWSGTRKMTAALVDNLGSEAPGGRRTFPTPAAMAAADEQFCKDVIRTGYRGPYLKALATDVAEGTLDLEELNDPELPDDEVAARLLELPGVGPYAAAHVMLTSSGRYSRLVLDSWTRPTYGKLRGTRHAERRDDRAPLQALRRGGRPRVLALPDAQLGRGRVACLVTVSCGAAGAGAPTGLQNQYGRVTHG
jgi:3-methyladenine DNA glycosylase/8-oxoguanine DNA glycosylase